MIVKKHSKRYDYLEADVQRLQKVVVVIRNEINFLRFVAVHTVTIVLE